MLKSKCHRGSNLTLNNWGHRSHDYCHIFETVFSLEIRLPSAASFLCQDNCLACAVLCPGTHHWWLLRGPCGWGQSSSGASGAGRVLSILGSVVLPCLGQALAPCPQMVTPRPQDHCASLVFQFKSCFVDSGLISVALSYFKTTQEALFSVSLLWKS